jgi:PKD repeat protein
MVGAGDLNHVPEWFTNYGTRVDVHGFGSNVYTLGYGDLYGSDTTNFYTATFGGTSSASPIIVGACAILQGIHKETHGRPLDYTEMHDLLKTHSTPQYPHSKAIGPMPNLQGSCDQVVGVAFVADTTIGWEPLTVNFSASSGLSVDNWSWNFGDGSSGSGQTPSYTYTTAGMFNVNLEIEAGEEIRSATKNSYIKVLADSIIADTAFATPGDLVEVVIYGRNNIPVNDIIIPVAFAGDMVLNYDHLSTDSCRTDYFEIQSQIHFSPSTKTTTFRLLTSTTSTAPDLPPGEGPILRIFFQVDAAAQHTQTTPILVNGYSTTLPEFKSNILNYTPRTVAGLVRICLTRGDMDGDLVITITDLVYFIDFMFNGGPSPFPMDIGDIDCSGSIDISDLVYLVDWMFNNGQAPCDC